MHLFGNKEILLFISEVLDGYKCVSNLNGGIAETFAEISYHDKKDGKMPATMTNQKE